MSTCHFDKWPFDQISILLTWHLIDILFCQLDITSCHFVNLTFHPVILSTWHCISQFVNLTFHHVILSTCHFDKWPLYQLSTSSYYDFINLKFPWHLILSTWYIINLHFVNLTFHLLGGISSNFCLAKLSFNPTTIWSTCFLIISAFWQFAISSTLWKRSFLNQCYIGTIFKSKPLTNLIKMQSAKTFLL